MTEYPPTEQDIQAQVDGTWYPGRLRAWHERGDHGWGFVR